MRRAIWVVTMSVLVAGAAAVGTWAAAQGGAAKAEAVAEGEGKIDPEFEKDIRALLEVDGTCETSQQITRAMLEQMKRFMPPAPEGFWDDFLKGVDYGEFVDLLVPIYARHMSHEDVKGLIAFYQTPLGRRIVKSEAAITPEAMLAGMTWGQQLGRKAMAKLMARQGESK